MKENSLLQKLWSCQVGCGALDHCSVVFKKAELLSQWIPADHFWLKEAHAFS
jgi:hypothetical protein